MTGDVQRTLNALTDTAESAWPQFRVSRAEFQERLLGAVEGDMDPIGSLASLHAPDAYLASGCERRLAPAIERFAEHHLAHIDRHLRRFAAVFGLVDEVRTELEDKLIFGRPSGRAQIVLYKGRGPLGHWVAVAARRTALSLLRSKERRPATGDSARRMLEQVSSSSTHVSEVKEIAARRHEPAVRQALRQALQSLEVRERTIVRLGLVEGISFTQIAKMLHVHQSTVSRSFQSALGHLQVAMRRILRDAHGFDDAEVDSIIRDVRSRIDLSVSAIWGDDRPLAWVDG